MRGTPHVQRLLDFIIYFYKLGFNLRAFVHGVIFGVVGVVGDG